MEEEKKKEVEKDEEGRSWRIKEKKKVERKENGKEKGCGQNCPCTSHTCSGGRYLI